METVNQAVDRAGGGLLGGLGQVRVAHGGGGAGMTQQALDMAQAQALFQQVGGKTVSQGVNGDFFLMPHCATTTFMAAWAPPRSIGVVAL